MGGDGIVFEIVEQKTSRQKKLNEKWQKYVTKIERSRATARFQPAQHRAHERVRRDGFGER